MSDQITTDESKAKKGRKGKKAEVPEIDGNAFAAVEPKLVTRMLAVKLTEAESNARGKELADTRAQIRTLEDAKKANSDTFKAKIELVEQRADELAGVIRAGEERREVSCVERHVYATNTVEVVRADNGEIVEKRAMRLNERQESLLPADSDPEAIDEPQSMLDGFSDGEDE